MKRYYGWFAAFVCLFLLLAYQNSQRSPQRGTTAHAKDPNNSNSATQVVVSKEDSEGVTNDATTVDTADAIGAHTLERWKHHTGNILDQMGSIESTESMTQRTVLIQNNGQNLAVTRLYMSGKNTAIQVAGIKGNEFIRVMCLSPYGDKEVVTYGKCANAINEQFDFALPSAP